MFCPQCRSEYVEGITECAECQVSLVEELPLEEIPEYDELVVIRTYVTDDEIELAKSLLAANGIEAMIASDTAAGLAFAGGARLLVHKDDMEKAETVFNDLESSPPEEEEEESEGSA